VLVLVKVKRMTVPAAAAAAVVVVVVCIVCIAVAVVAVAVAVVAVAPPTWPKTTMMATVVTVKILIKEFLFIARQRYLRTSYMYLYLEGTIKNDKRLYTITRLQ
jgi:hypothetical protein